MLATRIAVTVAMRSSREVASPATHACRLGLDAAVSLSDVGTRTVRPDILLTRPVELPIRRRGNGAPVRQNVSLKPAMPRFDHRRTRAGNGDASMTPSCYSICHQIG